MNFLSTTEVCLGNICGNQAAEEDGRVSQTSSPFNFLILTYIFRKKICSPTMRLMASASQNNLWCTSSFEKVSPVTISSKVDIFTVE